MDKQDKRRALNKCDGLGMHPKVAPMGDNHHTDAPFVANDIAVGDALSYIMGDLFIDSNTSPMEQWTIVARALRIHGLQISDNNKEVDNAQHSEEDRTP